jgi:histidinol phosphatase-like PHP family hydrolase
MLNPIIDMHCHTTNSDGAQSPEEVYQYAQDQDIAIHAITDHDKITRHPDFPAWIQQDGRLILEWVEVSARYERWDYRKSIHIPIYALSLRWELEDILAGIRRGKAEKVQRQCEQLRANGCMIELPDRRIVPFSYDAMRLCFPGTQEDGYNNAHLVELVLRHRDNIRKLEDVAPGIDAKNLMKEGFKSEWKYTKSISLRDKLPEYEPRIEELMEVVDRDNTIVSIAHPNYTFRSIEEFHEQAGYIMSLWADTIELNSTASLEWIEGIEQIRNWQIESYTSPCHLTYGSDCHDLYPTRPDARHSLLGDMNPYVSQTQRRASEIDIISRISSPADRRAYQEYLYQHYLPTLSE